MLWKTFRESCDGNVGVVDLALKSRGISALEVAFSLGLDNNDFCDDAPPPLPPALLLEPPTLPLFNE